MAKVLRTKWYDETVKVLEINGKCERTQHAYARAVRMLIEKISRPNSRIS